MDANKPSGVISDSILIAWQHLWLLYTSFWNKLGQHVLHSVPSMNPQAVSTSQHFHKLSQHYMASCYEIKQDCQGTALPMHAWHESYMWSQLIFWTCGVQRSPPFPSLCILALKAYKAQGEEESQREVSKCHYSPWCSNTCIWSQILHGSPIVRVTWKDSIWNCCWGHPWYHGMAWIQFLSGSVVLQSSCISGRKTAP